MDYVFCNISFDIKLKLTFRPVCAMPSSLLPNLTLLVVLQPAASRNQTVGSEVHNIQTVFVPINQAAASGSSVASNRTATFTATDNSRFSHVPPLPPQGKLNTATTVRSH